MDNAQSSVQEISHPKFYLRYAWDPRTITSVERDDSACGIQMIGVTWTYHGNARCKYAINCGSNNKYILTDSNKIQIYR